MGVKVQKKKRKTMAWTSKRSWSIWMLMETVQSVKKKHTLPSLLMLLITVLNFQRDVKNMLRRCSTTSTRTEMEKSPSRKSVEPNQKLKLKSSSTSTKMVMVSGLSKRSSKPSKHWPKNSMLLSKKAEEMVEEAFALVDTDGSGKVSKDE